MSYQMRPCQKALCFTSENHRSVYALLILHPCQVKTGVPQFLGFKFHSPRGHYLATILLTRSQNDPQSQEKWEDKFPWLHYSSTKKGREFLLIKQKLVAHQYHCGIPQSYVHKAKNWSGRQLINVGISK